MPDSCMKMRSARSTAGQIILGWDSNTSKAGDTQEKFVSLNKYTCILMERHILVFPKRYLEFVFL